MSTDSSDPGVNGSSGNGAVKPDATSGVNAELKNEIQKIVMGIVKDQIPRAVRSAIGEAIPEALKAITPDLQSKNTDAGDPAGSDKNTSKARIEALEKQLKDFQQQAKDSDERARSANLRGRVQSEVAKYLPASDPNHAAYMGMLYDLNKRFSEQDGNPTVKFKRDWGEDFVPLEAGVKELFEGELKHLVQTSKAGQLPATGNRGATGNPMANRPNGAQSNPLDRLLSDVAATAFRNPESKE